MATASGVELEITGRGIIVGVEGPICLDATHSLVSASQVCKEQQVIVIMDSVGAIAVKSDDFNTSHVNCIKTHSFTTPNQPLFSATLNNDALYELDPPTHPVISVVCQHNDSTDISSQHPSAMPCHMYPAVSCATDAWSPSPELIERNNRWVEYHKTALASFYSTAEFQTDRDLVRFFHEAWDHPSRELICKIVDSQAFDNFPKRLTSKWIRKLFLQCETCPAGSMAQQPYPGRRRTES